MQIPPLRFGMKIYVGLGSRISAGLGSRTTCTFAPPVKSRKCAALPLP